MAESEAESRLQDVRLQEIPDQSQSGVDKGLCQALGSPESRNFRRTPSGSRTREEKLPAGHGALPSRVGDGRSYRPFPWRARRREVFAVVSHLKNFWSKKNAVVVVSVPLRILENTPEVVWKIGERVLRDSGQELV